MRRPRNNVSVVRLLGDLVAQCLAAGLLTFPAVLAWVLLNEPERLRDFVWVCAAGAPPAAAWVVLRYRRGRLGAWWVTGRVAGLLVSSAAVTWVVTDPAGFHELDPLRIGAVLVLVWAWIIAWRRLDRGRVGRRPAPKRGEIWSALVPFEKGSFDQGEPAAKDRPCLVVSTFTRHAYVLKITSVDQADRSGYLRLAAGWHPRSEKESWIKVEPLLKVPLADFRQHLRKSPRRAWAALAKRYPQDATPRSPRTARRNLSRDQTGKPGR